MAAPLFLLITSLLFLLAGPLAGSEGAEAPNCTPAAWLVVAPNPTPRYGSAGASDINGQYFYSIGGYSLGAMLNNNDRYDVAANSWLPRAPIPVAVQDARAVHVFAPGGANRLYVFGGIDSVTNTVMANVQAYDIPGDVWLPPGSLAPMPLARYGLYIGLHNHKVYLAGGYAGTGNPSPFTYEYDVDTGVWSYKAPMPSANGLGAYVTIGQYLYTFGGWTGSCCNGNSYRYDMVNDSWTTLASLPTPVQGAVAGVVDDQIWIAGGGQPGFAEALKVTQVYHPATNTYTVGPLLNQGRARFAGGTIAAPGGVNEAFVTGGVIAAPPVVTTGISERSSCPVPVQLRDFSVE